MVAKDIWKRNWGGNSMEWKEVTLGEIGTIVGGATPSTKNTSFYDGNIPWLTPKDLSVNSNKYILRGERNITEAGFKSCSCKMLPKGSVLFSSRAPIGYVAITANDMCTNQGFKSVIPNEETDSEFLYYLLKYNKDNIASQGSGTTFAEVSGKTMKEIEVMVPKETDDQHRIASILSSLDRKIELNNKINADLEEMAQAIFKNWFVDFEPFKDGKFVDSELGMIPEGWKVGSPYEYAKVVYGAPYKSAKFNDNGEGLPLIRIRDLKDCNPQFYTPEILPQTEYVNMGDIVAGMDAEFVPHIWKGNTGLLNQRVCKLMPQQTSISNLFVLYLMKPELEFVQSYKTGTTVSHLGKADIDKFVVVLPPLEVVEECSKILDSILQRIKNISAESRTLSTLRDTLLPRLMSGEIEIPE